MLGAEIKTFLNPVVGVENQYAIYEGFGTSFLPWHDRGMAPVSEDGETALIKDGKYFILNGNWMLAYSELAPRGFATCFEFFCAKFIQFGSFYSASPEEHHERYSPRARNTRTDPDYSRFRPAGQAPHSPRLVSNDSRQIHSQGAENAEANQQENQGKDNSPSTNGND